MALTTVALLFAACSASEPAPASHDHEGLYLTETETVGLLALKADLAHDHDGRYPTSGEATAALATKADVGHAHDGLYSTQAQVDAAVATRADAAHVHDDRYYTQAQVDAAVAAAAPRIFVASTGVAPIVTTGEGNAVQTLLKSIPESGQYLARVDAELNTFGALYFNYACKLQYKSYPAFLGAPFSDLPGTRRTVSWRLGREQSGSGTTVSISMQAPLTAGLFGVDVRLVCWGDWDGASPPIVDFGNGLESATLVVQRVSSVN